MKKLLSCFLIFLFVCHAPIAGASSDPAEQPYYRKIADSVLAPAATTVLGYRQAGFTGALLGLVVGCADEVIVQTGFAEKHYLTAGVLGAATTTPLETPYYTAQATGFLAGLFIATGKFNHLLDKAGTALSSGLMGQAYGGTPWGIAGAACGALDEALQYHGITAKPYLSNIVLGISSTAIVAPWLYKMTQATPKIGPYVIAMTSALSALPMKSIIGVGIGAYASTGERSMESKSPMQLSQELYDVFVRVMDKETLDNLLEKQAIAIVTSRLLFVHMTQQINRHYQNMNAGYEALVNREDLTNHAKFWGAILPLIAFLPFQFAGEVVANVINSHFAERLGIGIFDGMQEQYLHEETTLKLGSDPNSTVLVEKMTDNLRLIAADGSQLLGDALNKAASGTYNAIFLNKVNGLDMIILLWLYNGANHLIEGALTLWVEGYTPVLNEQFQRVNDFKKEIMRDPHLIVPADKMPLIEAKLNAARKHVRSLQARQQVAEAFLNAWHTVHNTIDYVFLKSALVAAKIMNGELDFEVRYLVTEAVNDVSGAMSWGVTNSRKLQQIDLARTSIHNLLDKFANTTTKTGQSVSYSSGTANAVSIEINNMTVGVDDKTLVHEPHLVLNKGIYAASGKSGCGKSAFLSKIKGVVHNQFWALGEVRYLTPSSETPKVMLITQKDYLTPESSLLELILSKPISKIDVPTHKPRALALLSELNFDPNNDTIKLSKWLDENDAYGRMLSGGQAKKLSVVSAIMAKPDILILDEVFNGMDKTVIQTAQRMIKRELPDTLIIVVDHHAYDNNSSGFYDRELHFANQKIKVRDVQPNEEEPGAN